MSPTSHRDKSVIRALLQRASPPHRSHRSTGRTALIYTPAFHTDTVFYNHFLSTTVKLIDLEILPHMTEKEA